MFKGFLWILGLALITSFLVNHFSPRGIAWFGEWDTREGVISAKPKHDVVVHEREIKDIRIVKEIFDKGGAIFIDARTADTYSEGHIKGALSLPVGEMDQKLDAFIQKYPIDTHIITYCSGRQCDDSHLLADYLAESGFTQVQVFIDGFPAWEKEGYPIE